MILKVRSERKRTRLEALQALLDEMEKAGVQADYSGHVSIVSNYVGPHFMHTAYWTGG